MHSPSQTTKAQVQVDVPKPTILQRVWDTVLHYYNGFKLLALEIRVSSRLLIKTVQGKALSRRESKQVRVCVCVSVCVCACVCVCLCKCVCVCVHGLCIL